MNEFTCLICSGDLFISKEACIIIQISEVDRQLQSAGTLLLTSKSDNFPIINYLMNIDGNVKIDHGIIMEKSWNFISYFLY